MAEWARRMPWRRSASTRAVTVAPSSIRPSRRCPRWSVKPPSTWRVDHLEVEAGADDLARVAHLSAHLAVEGRFVEHDDDRLLVVDLVDLVAQLIVGDDADHLGVGRLRAFRSRGSGCRAWPFSGLPADRGGTARPSARRPTRCRAAPFPRESPSSRRPGCVRRPGFRTVRAGSRGFGTCRRPRRRRRSPAAAASSASKIRSMRSRPASMVARKLASSFSITPATAVDGFAQFGIRVLHQLGHRGRPACAGTARGRPSDGRPTPRGAAAGG